jgi:beta-alanine--pyruvate transaminase
MSTHPAPVDSYWMPFTANRDYRKQPRVIVGAEGHHYLTDDGRRVYDAFSGLWTCGLGHCHPKIVEAVQRQVAKLDYAIAFQVGHDKVFELAERVTAMAPEGMDKVFFTNSGSESVDSALKIALAYHRARGEGHRTRFIGRERGYHGVNFGGMSVGGMFANRKAFGASLLPAVDHLRHTHDLEHNRFTRGQPEWGVHLAEDLERLAALHDGSNIAAVITAFGRLGTPFAAHRFGVTPDLITTAKGLTNGVIPMGAVLVQQKIFDAMMTGPEQMIELFHGYTYSGHPVACAAGLAALSIYEEEGVFEQVRQLEGHFEDAIHSLADHPRVLDVRNLGLMGGVDLQSRDGAPGMRGMEIHKRCFWDEDILVRHSMDLLQFSPFLNSRPDDITMTFEKVRKLLDSVD